MSELITQNIRFWQLVIGVLVAGLIYFAFKKTIDFNVLDWWYRLPLIGKIARLSGKTKLASDPSWCEADLTLCADYKPFVPWVAKGVFDQRIKYMTKSGDQGRTPTPAWVMLFLVVLVTAEGLGFSFMLGTWMAREGSADTHNAMMIAIVLVLCGIMVWVTHSAGHQWYRTSLLRRNRKYYDEDNSSGKQYGGNTTAIALNEDQSQDDDKPEYSQIANRVGKDNGSYAWVIVAVVAIVAIATLSTVMRVKNLNQELIRETAAQSHPTAPSGNPFASGAPSELVASQKKADEQATSDVAAATQDEGMAAFLLLGFIFVITQIVGCSAGHKYGFAGKESKTAYKETMGCATFDELQDRFITPRIDIAQARLTSLQQRRNSNSSMPTKDFYDYLNETMVRSKAQSRNANSTTTADQPAAKAESSMQARTSSVDGLAMNANDDLIFSHLRGLPDKAAQSVYFQTLPPETQDRIALMITAARENAAKHALLFSEATESLGISSTGVAAPAIDQSASKAEPSVQAQTPSVDGLAMDNAADEKSILAHFDALTTQDEKMTYLKSLEAPLLAQIKPILKARKEAEANRDAELNSLI